MFEPKLLEEVDSEYSGKLRVMSLGRNHKYVSTGKWTQSGGVIEDVWKPALSKLKKQRSKSWLILGLATGTVAKLIAKKYKPTKIVGVEIDPAMIAIGKQYFDLDKIKKLEVKVLNARDYVLSGDAVSDFILVDMYLGDKLPDFVYSDKFLDKLEQLGQLVIFNHLFYEDWQREKAKKLIEKLKSRYEKVQLVRVLTNMMIICA